MREDPAIERWFPAWPQRAVPKVRLLCFPYAGGQAYAYAGWAKELGADVEVRTLQVPGRGMRLKEPPISDLGELRDAILPHLISLSSRPYAIFGHSLGAVVAFEVTRQLVRVRCRPPIQLFLSAARPPSSTTALNRPLHGLSDHALVAELRQLGGTPTEVLASRELLELFLPEIRADLRMLETWISPAAPRLDVPITVLGGRRDHSVTPNELEHWRAHATAQFDLRLYDGDHFYVQEHSARVATLIREHLDRALPA